MSLTLDTIFHNGWKVLQVEGIVDTKTVNELRDFLDGQVVGDLPVALDLTSVSFMSSAGLRTLLTLYRKTKSMGISFSLVGLQKQVEDTMKVTGFYQYFTVYPSIQDLP